MGGLGIIRGSERGISPVIGVILMVAITVVLAAGIGAFALGYGGNQQGPAPTAAVESSVDDHRVTFSVDSANSFDPDDAEIDLEVTVADTASGTTETVSISTPLDTSQSQSVTAFSPTVDVDYDPSITGSGVTAGDTFQVSLSGTGVSSDIEISSYDASIVLSESGSSSQILYSDTYNEPAAAGGGGGSGGGSVVSRSVSCSGSLSTTLSLNNANPSSTPTSTITVEVDSGSFTGGTGVAIAYSVTLEDTSTAGGPVQDTEALAQADQSIPVVSTHDIGGATLEYESFAGSDGDFSSGDRIEVRTTTSNSDLQITQFGIRLEETSSGNPLCDEIVSV